MGRKSELPTVGTENGGHSVIAKYANPSTDSRASRGWVGPVLYIEDNPVNLLLVRRIFRSEPGVEVLSATCARTGLEMARTLKPRIILLDLNLPDMHGQDLFALFQEDELTSTIPVVVLSADVTEQRVNRLLAAGVFSYLTKPLDFVEFENVMGFFLDPGINVDVNHFGVTKDTDNV